MTHASYWLAGTMLLCILPACSVHRTQVSSGAPRIAKELNSAGFTHTNALVLYDPATREFLFEKNADLFFTPASNTKIATLCAALHYLGDSTQTLRYTLRGDTMVFWGAYDPAFLYDSSLRCDNAFRLLKEHEGPLVYAPVADVQKYGPGWAWDDYNSAYQAERSTLPLFGNKVTVTLLSSDLFVVEPPYFTSYFAVNRDLDHVVRRLPDVNAFEINPQRMDGFYTVASVPYICSPYQTMELLRDTLGREVDIDYSFDPDAADYAFVHGEPVDSLYKRMMQDSDNLIAEQLLLQCTLFEPEARTTHELTERLLEGPLAMVRSGFRWYDGSGLSRYNLMTPRSAILLLDDLLEKKGLEYVETIMATGGVSGTIRDRFEGHEPYVFAKTGTLKNNYALSGYIVTASGRTLIFSTMHCNVVQSVELVEDNVERVLNYIHHNY